MAGALTASDPWPERHFRECVASGVPFLVATQDDHVLGYIIAHHAVDEAEILNLGVGPEERRRGIGRALVEAMLVALREHGITAVFLEVRESNASAIALYQKLGFSEVGRRPNYYDDPVENAIVMQRSRPADRRRRRGRQVGT